MKLRLFLRVLLWVVWLSATLVACTPPANESIPLASFTENYVTVSVSLERDPGEKYFLSATFLPPDGYHLYSKDISPNGVDGLGRPTRIELTEDSLITPLSTLTESVKAQEPDFEPKELFVYPAGAVTLRLPVELPPGNHWIDEEFKITYMACSAYQCKPPVEGKIVQVRFPCASVFGHP